MVPLPLLGKHCTVIALSPASSTVLPTLMSMETARTPRSHTHTHCQDSLLTLHCCVCPVVLDVCTSKTGVLVAFMSACCVAHATVCVVDCHCTFLSGTIRNVGFTSWEAEYGAARMAGREGEYDGS